MAMSKAELARMEALEEARDMARALRWPERPEPAPVDPATMQSLCVTQLQGVGAVMLGWMLYPSRALRGEKNPIVHVWCNGRSRGEVEYAGQVTPSQYRGEPIYITFDEAKLALQHAVVRDVARVLLTLERASQAVS